MVDLRVAKALVTSMEAKQFDIAACEDRYRDQEKWLIAAKRNAKTSSRLRKVRRKKRSLTS
jgi:non-homologous end joining protein Ku